MRLTPILLLALVVAVSVLDWELWHQAPAASPRPPQIPFIVHAQPTQPVEVEPADFVTHMQAMLAAGKFDELEAMAAADRQPSALYVSGVPKLYRFYEALAAYTGKEDCGCETPPADSAKFPLVLSSMEAWRHADPQSLAPRIALAGLWVRYAWNARGSGWSSDVGDEQWRAVAERLAEAEGLLIGSETEADPDTFRQLMLIGALRGWDRGRQESIYSTGIARFPWYMPLYSQHAYFIQTKWGGERGELDRFLGGLRQSQQGLRGQLAYSWVTHNILAEENADKLTVLSAYDFASFIAAYQQRETEFGLRTRDWNAIFLMACKARDFSAAETALGRIHDDWAQDIWGDRETFDVWVAWFHKNDDHG